MSYKDYYKDYYNSRNKYAFKGNWVGEEYLPLIKLGYDYEDLAVRVDSKYCDAVGTTITGSSETKTISSYEPIFRYDKSKRTIEATNETFERLCRMEEDEMKKMEEEMLRDLLPKPKHMMLNGDYTTIVWEDGTSTVLHLKEGETYDTEKAILYGVLKKIFNNKNADMDRYMCEFFDHAIGCNKNKKKKDSKKKKSTKK